MGEENEMLNEQELEKVAIEKVEGKVESKLTNNQKKILNLINANPNMILAELSEKTEISVTSVSNNLKKLTEKEIVKRVGSDKNGYWKIIDD